MCPDQGLNPQPWRMGTALKSTELPGQARKGDFWGEGWLAHSKARKLELWGEQVHSSPDERDVSGRPEEETSPERPIVKYYSVPYSSPVAYDVTDLTVAQFFHRVCLSCIHLSMHLSILCLYVYPSLALHQSILLSSICLHLHLLIRMFNHPSISASIHLLISYGNN